MAIIETSRVLLRWTAAAGFIGIGVMHFVRPDSFRKIVPPMFPSPAALVAVSGFFEIMGGAGLLVRPLRRAAGWGLIALLVAVFPANVYMAVAPDRFREMNLPTWALWLRLPFQAIFIACVWFVSKPNRTPPRVDA